MKSIQKHALVNGRIRTMDAENSLAEAVLVAGNQIEAVGGNDEILAAAGKNARVTDLGGKALYPGFIDTHSHISMYALWSEHAYCGADAGSLAGVLDRLRAQAGKVGKDALIMGWGYDDSLMPEKRGPTRRELDAISSDRPVLLIHISAHASYVNSKALHMAGLHAGMSIQGGEVVADERGEAAGTLLEMASFQALGKLMPAPDAENLYRTLQKSMRDYNAYGITGTHEGGVGFGNITPSVYLGAINKLREENKLSVRFYLAFMPECFTHVEALGLPVGDTGGMVAFSGPKFFNDGSIQAYTAALSKPYFDRPDHMPGTLMPDEKMEAALIDAHCKGYQIAYHGNGDVGIEVMIRSVEKAQRVCPRPDPRHILVHCQTVSDAQLERMKAVGIAPSFFGLHVWNWGDRHYERFLGPERAERIDPSGSAVRLGMKHSLHADTPVLPPFTLRSIHTAVNRLTRNGRLLGADQRISVEEAVRAYTSHAAWFHFAEKYRGTIEPGKLADFVLLSDDLMTIPPEAIEQAQVLMTMCDGRVVYENNGG